jgi:hypothetical protein
VDGDNIASAPSADLPGQGLKRQSFRRGPRLCQGQVMRRLRTVARCRYNLIEKVRRSYVRGQAIMREKELSHAQHTWRSSIASSGEDPEMGKDIDIMQGEWTVWIPRTPCI